MAEPSPDSAKMWNVERVALELGISVGHVRRLTADKRIPHHRVGNFLRFDPAELQKWLQQRKIDAVR